MKYHIPCCNLHQSQRCSRTMR